MPERRVIPTERSADLITTTVLVNGEELSSEYQILSITVEKEINRIPWAKIVLLDGDPAQQDFNLSNQQYFVPGNTVEVKAGYHSQNETIFKGLILRHNLKIRTTGALLIVECKDETVKMTVGRKSNCFYDTLDSDAIEEIAGSYGFPVEIESSSVVQQQLVQFDVSDWDFCVTRAQANGKVCFADDGKFKFKTPDYEQNEQLSLVFGATILDLDAEIDATQQCQTVTSFGWDAANQEVLEATADNTAITLNGNLSNDELSGVIELEKLELKDGSIGNSEMAQTWANAKKMFNQLAKIRGRVKFQGVANVKPDTTIVLAGVGDRFNGKVYVSGVKHQIADGDWTCDAQFGINPKWFSETVDINAAPAAGLMAAVNGLQVAKVTQLEEDPDGEYRVKVNIPLVNNIEEGIWARIASLDAGAQRGSFFRPELEDEVIVGFINDNPANPVILGMLNSSAKPAPIEPSDENHEKGFVTRSGIKLMFNDENESVNVETPSGKKITIDDNAGNICVEDEHGNKIVLNAEGISMETGADFKISASGDIAFEANNIDLKANGNFKAEGAAGSELSSSAITEIKGSLVNIN
ncbi:type VI secretion system tip protein VgrG [uncultured Draconibacterium sp.]|uniref:type VI secretion system tip protein VgrG n=1 Tax=uncultured Draconibacterium sp. TaxID=1573823 RepID=UPI0032603C32